MPGTSHQLGRSRSKAWDISSVEVERGRSLPLWFRDSRLIENRIQRSLRQGAIAMMRDKCTTSSFGVVPAEVTADAGFADEPMFDEDIFDFLCRQRFHAYCNSPETESTIAFSSAMFVSMAIQH